MSEQEKNQSEEKEVVIPVVEERIIIENGEEIVRRYEVHVEEVNTSGEPQNRNEDDS